MERKQNRERNAQLSPVRRYPWMTFPSEAGAADRSSTNSGSQDVDMAAAMKKLQLICGTQREPLLIMHTTVVLPLSLAP